MPDALIFISCSETPQHRKIASRVAQLVGDTTGFTPFFSQNVQSGEATTVEIFNALRDCAGLIAFLHKRGRVKEGKRSFDRSSETAFGAG